MSVLKRIVFFSYHRVVFEKTAADKIVVFFFYHSIFLISETKKKMVVIQ